MKINNKKSKNYLKNYAKYSNLAFQMAIIIAGGVIGGYYIDKSLVWDFPIFTLLLSFFSVAAAIYIAVKDLLRK